METVSPLTPACSFNLHFTSAQFIVVVTLRNPVCERLSTRLVDFVTERTFRRKK